MSGLGVSSQNLSVSYGAHRALEDVSIEVPAGQIHGLIGRNGAGKTTWLSAVASLRKPSSGSVLIDRSTPFEDAGVISQVCLIRESGDILRDETLRANLRFLRDARPSFSAEYAETLLAAFDLDVKRKPTQLSRGQQSAFGVVVGLASRAPVTMFDEVHLGMDAPSRRRFYDLLLEEYARAPRTFILSSHLVDELAPLVEAVSILHRGRLLLSESVEDLRQRGATVIGPASAVHDLTRGLRVIGVRDLGPTRQVTILDDGDSSWRARAERRGLDIGTPGLQDVFIDLTEDMDETDTTGDK